MCSLRHTRLLGYAIFFSLILFLGSREAFDVFLNQEKVKALSYRKLSPTYESISKRNDRNQTIDIKDEKHIAVIFSSCADDVSYYSILFKKFNCTNTVFFIYEKCLQKDDVYISAIRACLKVSFMHNSDSITGRAHEVYLRHICDNWSQLKAVNIFLKAKKNLRLFNSLVDLDPQEVSEISYMNLGASSRRAKSVLGLSKIQSEQFHKYLNHLAFPESQVSILNAYVAFQSNFVVSASLISKHPQDSYEYLYNFVMEKNSLCQADRCCTCEALERFWPILYGCTEIYTEFHLLHQVKLATNIVEPKVCGHNNNNFPVINLQPLIKESGRVVQKSAIILGVYFAALLRWDVLIPSNVTHACRKRANCEKKNVKFADVYDQEHFINRVRNVLNIEVRNDSPKNYLTVSKQIDPCPNFSCKRTIDEQVKKYAQLRLKGRYAIYAPRMHNLKFANKKHIEAFRRSILQIRSVLKEK